MSELHDQMRARAIHHAAASPTRELVDHPAIARRAMFFGLSLATTAAASWLMTDVLGGDGLSWIELLIVALFTVNFVWIAISFYTGLAGLALRATQRDAITLAPNGTPRGTSPIHTRTVIVVPIHNEDPTRVFAGLRATYESVAATGQLEAFDFFVLSDTRDPDIWVAEELAWADACRELSANGRIFYRRRSENTERKSGNLMEFCESWGGAYDHMIVLDADSVMSGSAIVRLVSLMEENPDAGIIQSPPVPTGRHTLFARVLQFISRVHGPTMAAGLSFWQLGSGNYWGHNAIIRTRAFTECCGLPVLSGRPPLGGPILSHDFVEAALMRRAGWKVWLIPELEGSWEELPSNVIDYAARDRRWCQGNMQHARLIAARGLKPLSRLHLFMGVMSFVSSPLWLLLLLTSTAAAFEGARIDHSFFPDSNALFPVWPIDRSGEMIGLLAFTLGMLVCPKLLSVLLIAARPDLRRAYGKVGGLAVAAFLELLHSALLAPVMMLLHTRFVFSILFGRQIGWAAQRRDDAGISFGAALWAHRWHVAIGLVWGGAAMTVAGGFFWWLLPVLAGLVLAPLLTRLTSSAPAGRWAARLGLFQTPEERAPPEELRALARHMSAMTKAPVGDGLLRLIEDPFASALHAALLPDTPPSARARIEASIIYEKLARLGADSLTREEKARILSHPVKPLDQVLAGSQAAELPDPATSRK